MNLLLQPLFQRANLNAMLGELVDSISDKGLMHAIELLEGLASRHPLEQKHSAGVSVPATIIKAA